jgi:hypothetical protein
MLAHDEAMHVRLDQGAEVRLGPTSDPFLTMGYSQQLPTFAFKPRLSNKRHRWTGKPKADNYASCGGGSDDLESLHQPAKTSPPAPLPGRLETRVLPLTDIAPHCAALLLVKGRAAHVPPNERIRSCFNEPEPLVANSKSQGGSRAAMSSFLRCTKVMSLFAGLCGALARRQHGCARIYPFSRQLI